jgi:hypothetical protein
MAGVAVLGSAELGGGAALAGALLLTAGTLKLVVGGAETARGATDDEERVAASTSQVCEPRR